MRRQYIFHPKHYYIKFLWGHFLLATKPKVKRLSFSHTYQIVFVPNPEAQHTLSQHELKLRETLSLNLSNVKFQQILGLQKCSVSTFILVIGLITSVPREESTVVSTVVCLGGGSGQ